jgi:hypothetical protein
MWGQPPSAVRRAKLEGDKDKNVGTAALGCPSSEARTFSPEPQPESHLSSTHSQLAVYNAAAIQIPEVLMSQVIPEKYRDLFQKRAFASLGTLMPDGRPQVTPVWCDFDGEHVVFNSAKGRQKDRNVRRDPRVSVAIIDPENPYRYLEIRGRVVEITEDGADDHINKLAKKYLGVDKYPYAQPSEIRVIYKIKPEHTTVMG